jgi:hypothetical protein
MEKKKFENKEKPPVNWRSWVKYPEHLPRAYQDQLDILADLLPEPKIKDRYSKMADFLSEAVEAGLLKPQERGALRSALGPLL